MNKLIIFGCGYSGQYLSKILENDYNIIKTNRILIPGNFVFDDLSPLPKESFEDVTHILISIPPVEKGDLVFQKHIQEISAIPTLKWLGYLSATSVYGDHQGKWVDESSELLAKDARGINRIKNENIWLNSLPELTHIFRLGGIYGPGRSVIEEIKKGIARRIYKEGQYFSRIHVEDIAQILALSMLKPTGGQIFNLVDDLPAPSHEVIEYYCDLLALPYP